MSERTPMQYLEVDQEFLALEWPTTYLSPDECVEGFLYWGDSVRGSGLAICIGENGAEQVKFISLGQARNGNDQLDLEVHYDTDQNNGCYKPYTVVQAAPEDLSLQNLAPWLSARHIEMLEVKLDWLQAMPSRLKKSRLYPEADITDHLKHLRLRHQERYINL